MTTKNKYLVRDAFFGTIFSFFASFLLYFIVINISIFDPFEKAFEDFNFTDIYYAKEFYDKTIYTANVLSEQAKESAQLLADQRAAAEQKQRDILREQEKARRNAELTNTINQTTNELLKLLQK